MTSSLAVSVDRVVVMAVVMAVVTAAVIADDVVVVMAAVMAVGRADRATMVVGLVARLRR